MDIRPLIPTKISIALIVGVVFLLVIPILAQQQPTSKKSDLEKKKKALTTEIEDTKKLLDEAKKNKKTSLKELLAIKKQINNRQLLIDGLQGEVSLLDNQLKANQQTYDSLQTTHTALKNEYARIANYAYKNRGMRKSIWGYLLGGDGFKKAFNRYKYLKLYSNYRRAQANELVNNQTQLLNVNNTIVAGRSQKVSLLNDQKTERSLLDKDKREQETTVKKLQKTEDALKAALKKKKNDAEKLRLAIENIIEKEIKAAPAKPKTTTKTKSTTKGSTKTSTPKETPKAEPVITLTPEASALSDKFEGNKGRLPWPVEKGFVSSAYGEHPHPVLKGITVKNNGIDIASAAGATVRAVYDGEVTGIVSIPGAGQAIIIRHGNYLTVYSNLASVSVSKGSKVTTKQTLGTVADNGDGPELHFEVWVGKSKVNPQSWLTPR